MIPTPQSLRDIRNFLEEGLCIDTVSEGRTVVRTLFQVDGDVVSTVFPEANQQLVEAHIVSVKRRIRRLRSQTLRSGRYVAFATSVPTALSTVGAFWAEAEGVMVVGGLPLGVSTALFFASGWAVLGFSTQFVARQYLRRKLQLFKDN